MHDRTHAQEKAAIEDALHNEGSNLGEQLQKLREELIEVKQLLRQRGGAQS